MITAKEWSDFVELYRRSEPPLAHRSDFGLGFRYDKTQQEDIERKHNISFGAYCLLGSYAGRGCFQLNEQLRQDKWVRCDEAILVYANLLNRALDELSGFNNNVCFRWSNLDENGFEYLKKSTGKTILMPQFWSTGYRKLPASDQFFEIHTGKKSNGRYISRIVGKPSEEEILFKSHTLFEVIDSDSDTIYLDEAEGDNFDFSLHEYFWKEKTYSERVFKKLFPETEIPVDKRRGLIKPDF